MDLLLEGFHQALVKDPELALTLIGVRPEDLRSLVEGRYPSTTLDRIRLVTYAADLGPYFESHSLFLLPARGDAFPTVVLESMAGGMVPMVSDATGNKEVVSEIAAPLVVPLDGAEIGRRILWYVSLPAEERAVLSSRARAAAAGFTGKKRQPVPGSAAPDPSRPRHDRTASGARFRGGCVAVRREQASTRACGCGP